MTHKQPRKKDTLAHQHNNNSKWKRFAGRRALCKERNVGKVKPQQQVICGQWWKEGVTVFLSGKPCTSSSSLFQNPSAGREIVQQAHTFVLYALEHPYSLKNGPVLMSKDVPSATPQGYWRPLTFLPFTSITTLLPTTARGIFSCRYKPQLITESVSTTHRESERMQGIWRRITLNFRSRSGQIRQLN